MHGKSKAVWGRGHMTFCDTPPSKDTRMVSSVPLAVKCETEEGGCCQIENDDFSKKSWGKTMLP